MSELNEFRDIKVDWSGLFYSAKVLRYCPHCGDAMMAKQTGLCTTKYESKTLAVVAFVTTCCDKAFFTAYMTDGTGGNLDRRKELDYILSYPSERPPTIPDSIRKISPRFVKFYSQAHTSELNNHYDLAAMGYRSALEMLVKDYAIIELGKTKDEVDVRLVKAIELFLPNVKLSTSADVVRLLGNDYTHYKQAYSEIDFETLKKYLNIFIHQIDMEYWLNHPPVSR